ncbi:DUF177 domain-containing protein [Fructilactobacillus vespulae]|uniref:DUF177 domain-containing protein n=1 Tax=Fructilactobacillus vespulae TaxID=1249630 RepID=UPI0039B375DB
MKWSFEKLQGYKNEPFIEEVTLDLKAELLNRYPNKILDATPFQVSVSAISDNGDVIIDSHVQGKVTVPSSRSLVPVELELDFNTTEVFVNTNAALNRYEDDVVVLLVDEDGIIDFEGAVVDNIIIQIPMQVLSPEELAGDEMPAGNDWTVISEDDYNRQGENQENVDPRLSALKKFNSEKHD